MEEQLLNKAKQLLLALDKIIEENLPEFYSSSNQIAEVGDFFKEIERYEEADPSEPLTDLDREALGKLIADGNTGGRLDSENESGQAVRIAWSLNANKWTE